MKKILSLFVVVVMTFSLIGCRNDATSQKNKYETTNEVSVQEKVNETEQIEEPVIETVAKKTTDVVVYRTKTGEKYHREYCRYLKSKIETTVNEAQSRGLKPCSVCQPES